MDATTGDEGTLVGVVRQRESVAGFASGAAQWKERRRKARLPLGYQAMTSFASLIAPMPVETFLATHYGKQPAHIRGDGARRLLTWARLNELLGIEEHWTDAHLKLVHNSIPIPPDQFCAPVQTMNGPQWRADPGRVQHFLAQGASLVGNAVETIAPDMRAVAAALGDRLGGLIGANLYVSFKAIGGFGPHYDLSDVFAFHCEGEKTWRIYEGQADTPVAFPAGEEAQVREHFRRSAGRVVAEVKMQPGDVLYLPRGRYHDALAQSDASLHVTFSVLPHTGKVMLRLLEQAALLDPSFRRYLPEARIEGEAALAQRLSELGDKLKAIAASPAMVQAVAQQQDVIRSRVAAYELPNRPKA
jgi:ribosomal protein L16 Arg81 hydroxylase